MLSYRHAFHAGNFADVLKHSILIEILDYLKKKEAPFCCIDTHAGAGKYYFNSDYAMQNKEFDTGIGKLWLRDDLPECIANYVNLVKLFNSDQRLKCYPGSPHIAKKLIRPCDRLFLYELHPTDFELLSASTQKDKRIKLFCADGFKDCLKALPPRERRGLILIDPSYEMKTDYRQVVETLTGFYKRFATGVYVIWYPVIDRSRNQQLEKAIQSSGIKNVQLLELGIRADSSGLGMSGCGLIVVNPPWVLTPKMQSALPWLSKLLGNAGEAYYRVQTLVGE